MSESMTEGMEEISGMDGCYEYVPREEDIVYEKPKGHPIAVLRPMTCEGSRDYRIEFFLYEVSGWHENDSIYCVSPLWDVHLKWDGCGNWGLHEDATHICGFRELTQSLDIQRWGFLTAHSMIKRGDKECAGIED